MINKTKFKIILEEGRFKCSLLEDLKLAIKNKDFLSVFAHIADEKHGEHDCSIEIIVNGIPLIKRISKNRYGYLCEFNNSFYKLLKSKSLNKYRLQLDKLSYPSGEYLDLVRDKDFVYFSKNEYFPNIDSDKIHFQEAIEEVIRAVNEFKDFMWEIFHKASDKIGDNLMIEMFKKEERYTAKFYNDQSFDWEKYCHKMWQDMKKPLIIKRVKSFEEHQDKYKKDKEDKENIYYYIADYYSDEAFNFLPLETAWKEYKKN
jgi:hypothetical protein